MSKILTWVMGILAIAMTVSQPAQASHGVLDDAQFFSADAIQKAERTIAQLYHDHRKEIRVVTVAEIPPAMQDDFNNKGKSRFFEDWGRKVFADEKANGVLIFVCKSPSHFQVEVGNNTELRDFTASDKAELIKLLQTNFKAKNFDGGLVDGVELIQRKMNQNIPARRTAAAQNNNVPYAPPPTYTPQTTGGGFNPGGLICVGIAILVIVFMIIGALNRRASGYGGPNYGGPTYGNQGGYGQGGGYAPQGGGFGRGLLGGLLGGALGAWGYDRFFGRDSGGYNNPNYGGGYGGGYSGDQQGAPPTNAADMPDTDSSGGGADFGSSSSDSSSSFDSGGGFSGGDSGGGGGDSGGSSGGDF